MSAETEKREPEAGTETATLDRGTYEILRGRLEEHARTLAERAEALNAQRLEIFGGEEMRVIGNERIRTENNCVPRDVRPVGHHLLFGYNVFIGLRTETRVADVLSLHRFEERGDGFAFDPVPADDPGNFLADPDFVRDFKELYKYYKETRLLQLRRVPGKLLAVFQTGAALGDVKVFRWAVDPDGRASYLDNRGERDHVFPPSHDFEWTATTREDHVQGRHPHVSIRDRVFVETVGGDLTVKVEDNTEDGLGIYREPVDEPHQGLDDAEILYAEVGTLILLRIRPYNEETWRHLVFNTRTGKVDRIDAIGRACLLLPEDHGIIFPGGYYLRSGETKSFEGDVDEMEYLKTLRSPNGEDVLYVFHERRSGHSILLPYNMIRKEVPTPIHCNGYCFFDDGKLVIFRSLTDEPTRVHPMQIWQTPFMSDEYAAGTPSRGTFLEKIGNAELVRGISDALGLRRAVLDQEPSVPLYEELIAAATRTGDAYHWLGHDEVGDLAAPIREIRATSELILDEFEKVQAIQHQAREAVAEAETRFEELRAELRRTELDSVDLFVDALDRLRRQRGHLVTLEEMRYVDRDRVAELEKQVDEAFDRLSERTVEYLAGEAALEPYHRQIDERVAAIEKISKVAEAARVREELDGVGAGLELLTEVVGGLEIEDATVRTGILEAISEVLAALNRARALLESRRKELARAEGKAEFGAQFKLLGQAVSGALAVADTPEKCDRELSKLMLQLEELESRFGEFDEFLTELATKREDVYEAFAARKQSLLDARQRRAERMVEAAERILDGIKRRAAGLDSTDELNTYFVSDPMVAKVRDLGKELRELQESVKADELDSRLKSAKEDAARSLRDRRDIFEEGAEVLKLGRHRFSVNTQPFDLTLVPRQGRDGEREMAFHLSGTDFYEPVTDPDFAATRPYWDQLVVSETADVYRGEYLAASILFDAEEEKDGLSLDALHRAVVGGEGALLALVRRYAAERYDEGYERGLHDQDAAILLEKLLGLYSTAGLLRFAPRPRALAALFWAFHEGEEERASWQRRAGSLARLRRVFAHSPAIGELCAELAAAVTGFYDRLGLPLHPDDAGTAGAYLFEELGGDDRRFVASAEAVRLRDRFLDHLRDVQARRQLEEELSQLRGELAARYRLAEAWLRGYLEEEGEDHPELLELRPALEEAAVLLLTGDRLDRRESSALSTLEVDGLLGQHPRIRDRKLTLRLDELLARLTAFRQHRVPGFRGYQQARHRLLEHERSQLRLGEYQPKVMSAFVRNRLIDQVYLPLIGDNLAKQMGALGEGKRTDQMGLLLLISPPGYGKTTLMEYVANRLGMVFVKVNGPALGHAITSLDPTEARSATARQEVEKIDFALEMGNNVLLYLDDIQHVHPELLQKFISLCDAQRRMEGVWRGRTRTYDLRGKRFAVCMAGNPYTESGEKFKIPDMLANRADTYNLGDVLEGKDDLFALSYVENSLTSNPVLAPLTTRESGDVQKLVRMAEGEEIPPDQLSHGYSSVELEEILRVLRKVLRVQQVLLAVNQEYIRSASQDDAFRTEPRFQLQGSYRNMNKLAEKIVPVMNQRELEALIDDHYQGEAQTLTTGAEANLLKLAELRGTLTDEQKKRWDEIKRSYARVQAMGGAEDDPATRLVGQLGLMSDRLHDIKSTLEKASDDAKKAEPAETQPTDGDALAQALTPYLAKLQKNLTALAKTPKQPAGSATQPPPPPDLTPYLEKLQQNLAALAEAPRQPAGEAKAPPQTDLTPYLEKLDQTLEGLAEAPRGREIVQTLQPGVHELLGQLATAVGDNLLPLVKGVGRKLKTLEGDDRKLTKHLDRTLKNLDLLRDLVASLQKIDTRDLGVGE